jgi:nucleoside-diphosphate-sugar epimerase
MSKSNLLVIGAGGQVGTELVVALRAAYGNSHVVASDIKKPSDERLLDGPFEILDAMDGNAMLDLVKKYNITEIYHLVAMLSATGEKYPALGWELNMVTLLNVLNIAKDHNLEKVYWPSSIAVFGPNTPREQTPQHCTMNPSTVYGISKLAGERWCEYYFNKYGVDVRSIRYPGLISWQAEPGGGTTDYAVEIFYKAIKHNTYTSFLSANTELPMLYMSDAIQGTIQLMQAPKENIKIRSSYNLAGFSFTPEQLAQLIKKHQPDFTINYQPDFRQQIADSWPKSINDIHAQQDWNWKPSYNLEAMVEDMLKNIAIKLNK